MQVKYKYLALGARFSYPEDSRRVFVKLTHGGQIAEWDVNNYIVCDTKQVILPINPEFLVIMRDPFTGRTDHQFPKTAYQEGYEYYCKCPHHWDNPYEKGTKEHDDWDEGYGTSFDDDCE